VMAYKFAAHQAETLLEDIRLQVGRTGTVTPVACLRLVFSLVRLQSRPRCTRAGKTPVRTSVPSTHST
jgi:hypothetical protein